MPSQAPASSMSRFPLKAKLVLSFLLVVFIASLISLGFSYNFVIFNINKRIDPEVLEASEVYNQRFIDIKDRSLVYTDILSQAEYLQHYLRNEVSKEESLRELRKSNEKIGFDFIYIVDVNKKLLMSTEDISAEELNNISDTNLVSQALTGKYTYGYATLKTQLAIVTTAPIWSNNKVVGFVMGGFYVNDSFLGKVKSSLNKNINFFNADGVIVASSFDNLNNLHNISAKNNHKLSEEVLKNLQNQEKLDPLQVNIDRHSYRVLYVPINNTEGEFLGAMGIYLSLEDLTKETLPLFVFMFLMYILIFIIAYFIASKLAKELLVPILTIKSGTEIIGKGNLNHKIVVNSNDESLDLAESFNQMTSNLRNLLEQVSAERNKFSIVLEEAFEGIFSLDLDRNISLFNKRAEEITGCKATDVLGKKFDDVFEVYTSQSQLSAYDFYPDKTYKKDTIVFVGENIKLISPYKTAYVTLTSGVIKEGVSANLGCIVTFKDFTEEKELEEMKLDFVSMAAHELRTPLTSIRGYISLLAGTVNSKFDDSEAHFFEGLNKSSEHLAGLVENLLTVANIERSFLDTSASDVDWLELVSKAVSEFDRYAKEKNIKLIFNKPVDSLPLAHIDSQRIYEVLSNLIANALKFTPEKGFIDINVSKEGNYILTSITDTGVGIPDSSIKKMFTKFYRVPGGLVMQSQGTGLGLYISKRIIEQQGGKIWVESKEGEGSTFYFTLPIKKD